MIQDRFATGQPVCWKDEAGVWHHGMVRSATNGFLEVECDTTGTVERINTGTGCALPPTMPFMTSAHPKNPESRVLLHAVSEAVKEVGISWDDVGLLWDDDIPMVVFADSLSESRINSVQLAVDRRTPDGVVPKQRHCVTLQL